MEKKQCCWVLTGPTASGKTGLSIRLAHEMNCEIVCMDSMQIYRGMDIGTAKPTREEMQGIPHHMIDVAEPEEDFSVSRYCEMAAPIVDDILRRGKTAVIAGGTGLYMDSLIRGNAFAPFPSTGVRERLEHQADAEGMAARVTEMEAQGCDINYTVLSGGNHTYTWTVAYTIEGIRDWLFAQVK